MFSVRLSPSLQLNYTHDPIADFINAVQSDVIAFASKKRYTSSCVYARDF